MLLMLLYAVGVSSSRVYPKTGCISALAPFRRLRACTQELTAAPPTPMKRVVTTPIIKSDVVPRPLAGGCGAFQWWGGAPGWQTGAGFMMICLLNAVTNVVLQSGPVAKRWELLLSERRGRVRPL
ncbi:hypothetical protein CF030_22325 [Klebsiella pneumoniae]|nr:hypothetical protein [Klebsiella pneumoniae]